MNLDGGEPDIKSFMGSLLSILLFAIVLLYAFQKTEILIHKENIDILTTINENALTSEDQFTYRNGFNVAVAFTAYDSETEWALDPTYGELVFKHNTWGENDDGTFFSNRETKQSHICSQEELGLTEDKTNAKFFPIEEQSLNAISLY